MQLHLEYFSSINWSFIVLWAKIHIQFIAQCYILKYSLYSQDVTLLSNDFKILIIIFF